MSSREIDQLREAIERLSAKLDSAIEAGILDHQMITLLIETVFRKRSFEQALKIAQATTDAIKEGVVDEHDRATH